MSDIWIGGERFSLWKTYKASNGSTERIRCRFGLYKLGDQDPYFSLTAEIKDHRGRDLAFGILEAEISDHFPELRKFQKWHLTGIGSPLHYEANAIYFWEKVYGISKWKAETWDPDPLEALRSTIIYDPESDEAIPAPVCIVRSESMSDRKYQAERAGAFVKFLRCRFDRMMGEFRSDMIELLEIKKSDMIPREILDREIKRIQDRKGEA